MKLAEEAVKLAVQTWGKRSLTELEAEERLSYSCEKVERFYRKYEFSFCTLLSVGNQTA